MVSPKIKTTQNKKNYSGAAFEIVPAVQVGRTFTTKDFPEFFFTDFIVSTSSLSQIAFHTAVNVRIQ